MPAEAVHRLPAAPARRPRTVAAPVLPGQPPQLYTDTEFDCYGNRY